MNLRFNTNAILILSVLMFLPKPAAAQAAVAFVETNLISTFEWTHKGHDDHKFKFGQCAGGGRKSTARNAVREENRLIGRIADQASLTSGMSMAGSFFPRSNFNFSTKTDQQNGRISLSLNIQQTVSQALEPIEREHDCHHQSESGKPTNVTLSGQISFVMPLPPGVVLVRARRAQFTSENIVLNSENLAGFTESIEQINGKSKYNDWVYVWGPSNGNVRLAFDLKNVSGLRNTSESYQVEFEPVYPTPIQDSEILAILGELRMDGAHASPGTELFKKALALVARPGALNNVLEKMSLSELSNLGATFNDQANGSSGIALDSLRKGNQTVLFRVLTQFVFETLSLKSFKYCGVESVSSIVQNGNVSVQRAVLAQTLYSRAVWSARYFDFKRYEALFSEYQSLGNNGHTYKTAMENPDLEKAIKLAARAMTLSFRTSPSAGYPDVLFYLQKLADSVPSLRGEQASFENLLEAAKNLNRNQVRLNEFVNEQYKQFTLRSNSRIDLREAISLLRQTKAAHYEFLKQAHLNSELLVEQMSDLGQVHASDTNITPLMEWISAAVNVNSSKNVEQEETTNRIVNQFSRGFSVEEKQEIQKCLEI